MSMIETPPFTPPGIRSRRASINNGKHPAEPLSKRGANFIAFIDQVDALQNERDRLGHDLDTANARLEQFQSNETRLLSELEGERARTAEAKAEAEAARTKQAQLETVIIGARNALDDALPR